MDIYGAIRDFIEMIISYIKLLTEYVENANMMELLNYLFICIPEEVRAILIVLMLLLLILGIRKAVKG